MPTVPSNLVPTKITQLTEYLGASTDGYLPYVIDGVTYKVQFSNIAAVGAVPSSRTVTGGDGLAGGGDLSANRVIYLADGGVTYSKLADSGVVAGTYGSSSTIPVLAVDAKGRVTTASSVAIDLTNYVPTSRAIIAGDGLTGGGTLTTDRTISLALSTAEPQPGGVPAAGTSTTAARDDHVHPAVDLSDTTETSGVLPMSRGGTGSALTPAAGAILYSTGSQTTLSGAGSSGQFFVSGGVSGPSWFDITGGSTGLSFGFVGSDYALGGTLAIAYGGTGATTVTQARINLLPSYTGNAGNVLALNAGGTDIEWKAISGTGTVTSVDVSGGTTGLTTSGGPVTTVGTITLDGTLITANGGTGLSSYTAGDLLYYASGTVLSKLAIGSASRILTSSGSAPQWTNPTSVAVGTATNLAGGAANRIAYQTASGTTDFITAPAVADTYLNWTGTAFQWASNPLGTVTSVAMSVPTGLQVSGSPITTSGTLAVSFQTGYSIPTDASQSNWNTAYSERLQWDGGSTNLVAATGRTSLGATTIGSSLFTLTNPSAVTFPRFNADNTVSALSASAFRTAIGAGTGDGSVTSVSGTGTVNGITLTGTVTTTGSLTLGGTLSGVSLTTQVTGTLPVANGGTNGTATPTAGAVAYGTGTAYAFTSAGTAGQVLLSNGSSAPSFGGIDGGTF